MKFWLKRWLDGWVLTNRCGDWVGDGPRVVDGPEVGVGDGDGNGDVNLALFLIFPYPHAFDDVEEMGFPVGSRTLEITCGSFKKHT